MRQRSDGDLNPAHPIKYLLITVFLTTKWITNHHRGRISWYASTDRVGVPTLTTIRIPLLTTVHRCFHRNLGTLAQNFAGILHLTVDSNHDQRFWRPPCCHCTSEMFDTYKLKLGIYQYPQHEAVRLGPIWGAHPRSLLTNGCSPTDVFPHCVDVLSSTVS